MLYNTIPRTALNDSFCSIINLSSHVAILTPAVLSTTLLFHFLHRYQGTFERVYPSFSPKKMHHIPPPKKKKTAHNFWIFLASESPLFSHKKHEVQNFPFVLWSPRRRIHRRRGQACHGVGRRRLHVFLGNRVKRRLASHPRLGRWFHSSIWEGKTFSISCGKKTFSIPITQKFPNFLEG